MRVSFEKNKENYEGQKFGKMTVLRWEKRERYCHYWTCICECGNEKSMSSKMLLRGPLVSCGCVIEQIRIAKSISRCHELAFKEVYEYYKNNAKKRSYEFCLSFLEAKNIMSKNCFYCGKDPKPRNYYLRASGVKKRKTPQVVVDHAWVNINGIDRYNNNRGYFLDNCVPCCSMCNLMKKDLGIERFTNWLNNIKTNWTINKEFKYENKD